LDKQLAPTERLQFLDAVRGFALLLMIVNHTGRWWQDGAMGWPRYNLIFASMAVGAPLFLFLVGSCMPLSFARRRPTGSLPSVAAKFLQRGARLLNAALLVALVYLGRLWLQIRSIAGRRLQPA
jgi:uncharacterized membrane protein